MNETASVSPIADSMTLLRAFAIAGIIVENFVATFLSKVDTPAGLFTLAVAAVSGSFVHLFFVLSGYGLTLAYFRKSPAWGFWARARFVKVVVPYWFAVVSTFILADLSRYWTLNDGLTSFSWVTLLSYIVFLRNFYEPGWTLNWSLWFMPVIIGLYAFFPVLIQVVKRAGVSALIVLSLVIGNVAIAGCVYWGYPMNHQAALPFFFVDEFAMGMILAWITFYHPGRINRFMDMRSFILGFAVYAVASLISRYEWLGTGSTIYNDILQVIGLLGILLYICRMLSERFPRRITNFLRSMSKRSYAMYLIHGPIILYVLKPLAGPFFETNVGPLALFPIASVFILLMYASAEGIYRLASKLAPASLRTLPARR